MVPAGPPGRQAERRPWNARLARPACIVGGMGKKSRGKKRPESGQPAPEPPVPVSDYFERRNIDDTGELEWIVDDFVRDLEEGYFLQWEAVVRQEQGLALSREQEEALEDLIDFGDDDDRILYINESPRPSQAWYEIARALATRLVVDRFRTADSHYGVVTEGWPRMADAIDERGAALSRPEGVRTAIEVIAAEVRHDLWIQSCFEALSGIGQEDALTLVDPEEQERIDDFIERLSECRDSVRYCGLTLETLLSKLILPERDEAVFVKEMMERLGLQSPKDPIAEKLSAAR
jgi:hypothetical protein